MNGRVSKLTGNRVRIVVGQDIEGVSIGERQIAAEGQCGAAKRDDSRYGKAVVNRSTGDIDC